MADLPVYDLAHLTFRNRAEPLTDLVAEIGQRLADAQTAELARMRQAWPFPEREPAALWRTTTLVGLTYADTRSGDIAAIVVPARNIVLSIHTGAVEPSGTTA